MQDKSLSKFKVGNRLSKLRLHAHMTWSQVASLLKVTPSMVYQVLKGKKNLSDKAIYLLEEAEAKAGLTVPKEDAEERPMLVLGPLKPALQSVAKIHHAAQNQGSNSAHYMRLYEFLWEEFTSARAPLSDGGSSGIVIPVAHKTGHPPKNFPHSIKLQRPPAAALQRAFLRFMQTTDEKEILLCCMQSQPSSASRFLDDVFAPSAYGLAFAACQLALVTAKESPPNLDKLPNEDVLTGYENLTADRDRLRMFYEDFYNFAFRVLSESLAARFKMR